VGRLKEDIAEGERGARDRRAKGEYRACEFESLCGQWLSGVRECVISSGHDLVFNKGSCRVEVKARRLNFQKKDERRKQIP